MRPGELLDNAIQDTRTLTFEISPPLLYELGFEPAVEWLIEQFRERHNIPIEYDGNGDGRKLDDDVSFFLFKSVRELLFNVIKHARADRIKVSVRREKNRIRISIQDDGVGFDFSKVQFSVNNLSGFGLFSMRERMEHFGGNFDVESKPGQGTRITLIMSLKPAGRRLGQMDKTIKVVIADDHMIVRDGLRSLLERQPDMEVVAEADNGRIALKLVKELSPDVVIMDIGMRELNGIDATRQIVKMSPGVKVLALSMYSDKRFIKGMLKAGASGYMLKDSAFKELIDAIRVIVGDKIYISPSVASIVTEDYLKQSPESDSSTRSLLTSRELEVLQLLVEGMSTKQIASSLRLSIKTIESHRSRVMKKIDVNNIADLTRYAIREGIISL